MLLSQASHHRGLQIRKTNGRSQSRRKTSREPLRSCGLPRSQRWSTPVRSRSSGSLWLWVCYFSPPTTTDDVLYSQQRPPVNTVLVSHPRPNRKFTSLTNHPWIRGGNLVDRDLDHDLAWEAFLLEIMVCDIHRHDGEGEISPQI